MTPTNGRLGALAAGAAAAALALTACGGGIKTSQSGSTQPTTAATQAPATTASGSSATTASTASTSGSSGNSGASVSGNGNCGQVSTPQVSISGCSNDGSSTPAGSSSTTGSSGDSGGGSSLGGASQTVGPGGTLNVPASATQSSPLTYGCNGGGTVNLGEAGGITLTILGHCTTVNVDAGGTTVKINQTDQLSVAGSGNTVTYACGNPQISNNGTSNTISQGGTCQSSSASSSGTSSGGGGATVAGTSVGPGQVLPLQQDTTTGGPWQITCNGGGTVQVQADNLNVNITGHCDEVDMTGTNGDVNVTSVTKVVLSGDNNDLYYASGSQPQTTNSGTNNDIHQGTKQF